MMNYKEGCSLKRLKQDVVKGWFGVMSVGEDCR